MRWHIEGSTWLGSPDEKPDDWMEGREFSFEVEAVNCIEALALAAQQLALRHNEEIHTIMSVHAHVGRKRKK